MVLFGRNGLAIQLECFTGSISAAAGIFGTDSDVTCHTAAVLGVIHTVCDFTMNVFDFFIHFTQLLHSVVLP